MATTASIDFGRIKLMNKKMKYTVYGYIRKYEKIYSINAPIGIINLCLLFYAIIQEWDIKYLHENIKIDGDKVTQIHDGRHGNAYLKGTVKSGINRWKFKITNCQHYNAGYMLIGIRRIDNTKQPPLGDTFFTNAQRRKACGYAFIPNDGKLTSVDSGGSGGKYGVKCQNHDIVEMNLDLNKLSLSYIINNKDYGKAFDVEYGEYKVAIWMWYKGSSITLQC